MIKEEIRNLQDVLKSKANRLNEDIKKSGIDYNIPITKQLKKGDTFKHTSKYGSITEYIVEEEEIISATFLNENKYVVMCGYIAFPDVKGLNQRINLKEILSGAQKQLYKPKRLTLINRVA